MNRDFYYNADEVDSAVANIAAKYPTLASAIALPNKSVKQRAVYALHLRTDERAPKDKIMLIGGVHGDEEGSCDILLEFVGGLLDAYSQEMGIQFGDRPGRTFDAAAIQKILSDHDLVVCPLVNPDGHIISQTTTTGGGRANANGVDLQRNFEVMFEDAQFHPNAVRSVSKTPGTSYYRGTGAFSEPETLNVKELLDKFPTTRWFVDLHSAAGYIGYGWACDTVQLTNQAMNFAAAPYRDQGQWGVQDDAIAEYVDPDAQAALQCMAAAFASNLSAVAGTPFLSRPSFISTAFPGTSHDYAFGLHKLRGNNRRILSFLVEWGNGNCRPTFNPDMQKIIVEVCSGLTGFCLSAK